MSKMDALRAMREERYAEAQARAGKATSAQKPAQKPEVAPPAKPTKSAKPAKPAGTVEPAGAGADALCGHRSMNGRTCTREQGHAAKSHRYG